MNIIIGKYGQKIEVTDNYKGLNVAGGKIEISSIIRLLAYNNPNIKFWIISRSNVHEMSTYDYNNMFPHGNVVCIYDKKYSKKYGHNGKSDVSMNNVNFIEKVLIGENVNPKAAIVFPGIGLTSSILPNTPKVDGTGDVLLSDTALYGCTSKALYLNKYHEPMKIIDLCTDPNYTTWKQAKDLHYHIDEYYAQHEYDAVRKCYIDNTINRDFIEKNIHIKYMPLQESYMYNNECLPIDPSNKKDLFTIVLNEGQSSRYNMLNEWVLSESTFKDVSVYGKWKHPKTINDNRFKGFVTYDEVEQIFQKTRCSFIIPIEPEWVTVKYLEMLRNGVIPLFHPSYDSNNRLNTPSWMRPTNKKELITLVESFKDDNVYMKHLEEARHMLYTHTDGSNLNNLIMCNLIENYEKPEVIVKKKHSLLDFM